MSVQESHYAVALMCCCLSVGVCSHMTRWYSRVVMQSRGEELVRGLKLCLQAAMKKFHEVSYVNNRYHNEIIVDLFR